MSRPSRAPDPASQSRLADALMQEEDKLLTCVHCGFCLPVCPTYVRLDNEADSPRGRLHLMRAVVEGRLDPADEGFRTHIDQCLGCRACEPVCPSGVRYGFLLERARAVIRSEVAPGPLERALLWTMRRRWATRLLVGAGALLRDSGLARLLMKAMPGRAKFALAMLAGSRAARRRNPSRADLAGRQPAAMLDGCVQRVLFARVNHATRSALEGAGYDVRPAPGQGCCGALHAHAGRLEEARALARANVTAFGATDGAIVVNAAGCGAFMKEYGELLERSDVADAARAVAERVVDVSEALARHARHAHVWETDADAPAPGDAEANTEARQRSMVARRSQGGGKGRLKVAYDEACHLHHGQRVAEEPYALLRAIDAIELVPLRRADECCGGAGTYGLTHPDLGGRILRDKIDAILDSGADIVATANPGCMLQIGAGLALRGSDVEVVHPVELVARYGGDTGMRDGG